jgi:hypothetical protein
MYNEQIETLINHALADGEITELERQLLFKRAEAFGIDLEEFEMVLDSKLFERQKNEPIVNKTLLSNSEKIGEVKKCSSCGEIVPSFSTKCANCDVEYRNVEASKNSIKFFEKLDELESQRTENLFEATNSSSSFTVGTLFKWWLFWWILIPLKVINFLINKTKPVTWSALDQKKQEMILNFPVPNSKEDIIEFITLSVSKINKISLLKWIGEEGKYLNKWNKIWIKKCEQVFNKAKFTMLDDPRSLKAIEELLIENKILNPKK